MPSNNKGRTIGSAFFILGNMRKSDAGISTLSALSKLRKQRLIGWILVNEFEHGKHCLAW